MTLGTEPLLLTVDTNIVIARLRPEEDGHEDAKRLLSFHGTGFCDIVMTTRVDADVPDEPLRSQIKELPVAKTPPIGSAFRLDVSTLDSGDMLAGPDMVKLLEDLMMLVFPNADPKHPKHENRIADMDHLAAHKWAERDIFVTDERAMKGQRKALAARYGIHVMGLSEVVQHLERVMDEWA